jgi:hypothetical protein
MRNYNRNVNNSRLRHFPLSTIHFQLIIHGRVKIEKSFASPYFLRMQFLRNKVFRSSLTYLRFKPITVNDYKKQFIRRYPISVTLSNSEIGDISNETAKNYHTSLIAKMLIFFIIKAENVVDKFVDK